MKKLILFLILITALFTSCKKDPTANASGISFKVSAPTALQISISLSRPTPASAVGTTLDNVSVNNVTAPYSYIYTKIQSGDQFSAIAVTDFNQPITGTLNINGKDYDATYTITNISGQEQKAWVVTVP